MNVRHELPVEGRLQFSLGGAVVLGVMAALALVGFAVARHPASAQQDGSRLLWMDVGLLLMYGIAGLCAVRYQNRPAVNASLSVGARVGVLLGAVLVANHVIEIFVLSRPFFLIIAPVFLTLALFGAAGSAARERTGSLMLGVVAGVWGAVVAMLILLCAAFCIHLVFERAAEMQLREAFAASGMSDAGAFLVRNSLDAAAEGLIRMPLFAVFLSFPGAVTYAWLSSKPSRIALAVMCVTPVMFVAGAAALWHANALQRSDRPPFVMAGVLFAGLALCTVHAAWSAWRLHAEP